MEIKWEPAMATGVVSVDQQHQVLIRELNNLLTAMSTGKGREAIEPILGALAGYAKVHFTNEEDCMRKFNCPVAAQNVSAHRHFVSTFQQIDAEYRATGASSGLAIRVQRELGEWIARHIKGTDTALRDCVRPN